MQFIAKAYNLFDDARSQMLSDWGLLVLRLSTGLMMAFAHGWGKIGKLLGPDPIKFADPIGIGMGPSLFLAGTAEFFGALLIAVGFCTRLSAFPLAITMLVAAFIAHADDPWGKKEFALLYFFPCVTLMLSGPGRLSIDHMLKKRFSAE